MSYLLMPKAKPLIKPKDTEMTTYSISRNDDEPIGMHTTDLDAEAVLAFLQETDAYFYSVSEWDNEENEIVERLNGDEWLNKYTTFERVLK